MSRPKSKSGLLRDDILATNLSDEELAQFKTVIEEYRLTHSTEKVTESKVLRWLIDRQFERIKLKS